MPLFRVPYRWLPSTFWRNIYCIWRDLYIGVYNVFRWIPVIWFDRDWDWVYLADIMEYKLNRMGKTVQDGCHLYRDRDARRIRMAALLLTRLSADDYGENASKAFKYGTRPWAREINAVQKQDQEMLGKLIGKYFTHWWD
jgi:hypothetical protein